MKSKYFLTAGLLFAILSNAVAQTVKVPLTLDAWDTIEVNPIRETYKGKECLLLKSGGIVLKNAQLRDGTIEADISFPQQRNFPGFVVRMQDMMGIALVFGLRQLDRGIGDLLFGIILITGLLVSLLLPFLATHPKIFMDREELSESTDS